VSEIVSAGYDRERFHVTGVDVSAEQLRLARANAPDVELIHADFTELELPPARFDAVASFYAFNHVPRERLAPLLADIHRWLVPGGLLLAAFGAGDTPEWTGEWLGTTMFFSSFPRETNSRLLREAGFELLRDELATMREPEGDATFQWILARR
jgi:SAM-dependent methyltransferase